MNIFCVDKNATIAAQQMCDKHIIKQIVESAQMLANCFSLSRLAQSDCPRTAKGTPRLHGYSKHPCTLWTMKTSENMQWLIDHALAMLDEKIYRYGSGHFCKDFLHWCDAYMAESNVSSGSLTEFAIAISPEQKCRKHPNFDDLSPVEKYRLYYIYDKASFCTWKNRSAPEWFSLDLIKN